ncbi:MAG: SCO family protein [Alphaproteobacteria bacterium]|nr:SCO family protein [Alphaproteobacteria bacterium]
MPRTIATRAVAALLALGLFAFASPPVLAGAKIIRGGGEPVADDQPRTFVLTDHNGELATNESFLGSHLIVYFGYTHCPDICPTSLQTFTEVLEALGPDAENVRVAFITVDPDRDTPERMKEYVAHFHPRIVGLTGPKANIAAAASAYKIRYDKVMAGSSASDYEVDHSSSAIFMGPDGRFLGRWAYGTPAQTIAADVQAKLK